MDGQPPAPETDEPAPTAPTRLVFACDRHPPAIALLVDADNAALDSLDQVLSALTKQGRVQIRRAYGNWFKTALRSRDAELNRHGFRAIQQSDPVKGEPQIALSQGTAGEPGDGHDGAS